MESNLHRLLADYPLDTLLQTIPTGLLLVDADRTIVYWNAEAERITGYSATEVIGRHCSFLGCTPCDQECDLFAESVVKPAIGLICTLRHKDGRRITTTKNLDLLRGKAGRVIGGIEAFVDISRLKELENNLRSAVEKQTRELELEKAGLRAVLDGMIDPAYICDRNHQLTFANRAMQEVVGKAAGAKCHNAIYHLDRVCEECPLQRVLAGEIVREERALDESGKIYEIIHTPYPLARNPTHKLGVCRDITERLEVRRRLQQANRELDAFVSTVSHDLRSPLTPLIGFADLLEERYGAGLDAIGRECIREIKKTAEKMKALLEDLLSLSRVGQLKDPAVPQDATSIAEDVLLELADKVVEHQAQIKISALPEIRIPEPLLADMFRNLLANALKYAAGQDPRIEVSGRKFSNRVRYSVVDHGPGIDAHDRERIFEPFQRGNGMQKTPGTGIGLATVAKIARVYGGNAWVEETPGGGATFLVDFPVARKS